QRGVEDHRDVGEHGEERAARRRGRRLGGRGFGRGRLVGGGGLFNRFQIFGRQLLRGDLGRDEQGSCAPPSAQSHANLLRSGRGASCSDRERRRRCLGRDGEDVDGERDARRLGRVGDGGGERRRRGRDDADAVAAAGGGGERARFVGRERLGRLGIDGGRGG